MRYYTDRTGRNSRRQKAIAATAIYSDLMSVYHYGRYDRTMSRECWSNSWAAELRKPAKAY